MHVGAYTDCAEVSGLEIDRTAAARSQRITPPEPSTTAHAAGEREAADARLDRIELSPAAREIQVDDDATREAKLAALRAQIDAGTYQVDAAGVAHRIVVREDL